MGNLKSSTNFEEWIKPKMFESSGAQSLETELRESFKKLSEIVEGASKNREQIKRDEKLSLAGKQAEIRSDITRDLQKIEALLPKDLEQRRQNIKGQMVEPPADPKDLASQIRQREIRDRLFSLSPAKRMEVYHAASQTDDLETVQAVESAPKSFPVAPADQIEKVRAERLERTFPQFVAQIKDLAVYENYLKSAVDIARGRVSVNFDR